MKYKLHSPTALFVFITVFIILFSGCSLESDYLDIIAEKIQLETYGDPVVPDDVYDLRITEAGAGEITITWTDPVEPTYSHAEISWTPEGTAVESVYKGENTFRLTDLGYGKKFYITVVAVTESEGRSDGVSIAITIPDTLRTITCITTADELAEINGSVDPASHYLLLNDLSLSEYTIGEGWNPIGSSSQPFMGTFDGNEYGISGLYISRSTAYNGLFGDVSTGTIMNLRLTSIAVHCQAADYVGGLAGRAIAGSVIKNILVSGDVSGSGATGGIIGAFEGDLQQASFRGGVSSETGNAGGLIGEHQEGPVSNSYAMATVNSNNGAGGNAGGIIGTSANGSVSFCYAKSNVTGAAFLDGLVAQRNGISVTSSYFDAEFFNGSTSPDTDEEKTTLEMKNQFTYSGWDFSNIWSIDTSGAINEGYPYLTAMTP